MTSSTAAAQVPIARIPRSTVLLGILFSVIVVALGGVLYLGMRPLTLFSEVNGQLTRSGEAASGITLTRTWRWPWTGETGTDTITTDAEGRFQFPAVERRSIFARFLPHEPNIYQKIVAVDMGEGVEVWENFKSDYDPTGELGGRPSSGTPLDTRITAICDLSAEPGYAGYYYAATDHLDPESGVYGRCKLSR